MAGPTRSRSRKVVNYSWTGTTTASLIVVAPLTKVFLGSFALVTPFEETVVRARGVMFINSDQSAGVEQQLGAFGLIRVTNLAVAAGAASIPGPSTDITNDGWLLWQGIAQQGVVALAHLGGGMLYHLDSKAQRIVREGQSIAMMVENTHATHTFTIGITFRLLSRFRG